MSKIYNPPFVYDPYSGWIECKGDPDVVAQRSKALLLKEETGLLLIRGWGGLCNRLGQRKAAMVQDAFGRRVAQLLNEHGVGEEVVAAMKGKEAQP